MDIEELKKQVETLKKRLRKEENKLLECQIELHDKKMEIERLNQKLKMEK